MLFLQKRTILWCTLLAFPLFLLSLFAYGPLFPWSPVRPGYAHLAMERADIYYPKDMPLQAAYRQTGTYIAESEVFHRLMLPARIQVIVCDGWPSFWRFMPQFLGSRSIGAVTLATGTVIYVTPRPAERGLDIGEFLRHEISHAAIHQNQALMAALRMQGVEWLFEGIAVSAGRQKSYYSREGFLGRARRDKDLLLVMDSARRKDIKRTFDIRYAYSAWRYFTEHLMARDRFAFQRYLLTVMKDPRQWRAQFAPHFGIAFENSVLQFQSSLVRD